MSEKKDFYKEWCDSDSKSSMPRTTYYYEKRQKLMRDANYLVNSSESSSSNSSTFEIEVDQKNIQQSQQVPEVHTADDDNVDDHAFNRNVVYESCTSDNDLVEDGDWIGVFNTARSIDHEASDSAAEEEIQFHENLKKQNKERAKTAYLNKKITHSTNICNGEVILMCMLLGVRHSFTWVAMMDTINLINKVFHKNILNLSKYKLFTYFPEHKEWYKYHIYCSQCKGYIGELTDLPKTVTCPSCSVIIENVKNSPYFLTLDIKHQFKELLENPLIQPHLGYKFSRQKQNIDNIEDIYDGELYKHLSSPGQTLHDKDNFSYIFNTDGCKAADSSMTSLWPVYLKITELPPEMRNKHLLLVGLWVNTEKPVMNTFLQPLIQNLNNLSSEGVTWKRNGENVVSKCIPLCCCVDSVCRCSILNMEQYNGLFGCTFCYHPTENVAGTRKYPIDTTVPALRTHENIVADMKATQQIEKGKIVFKEKRGVKGPSILMNLEYFNLSDSMTPDAMHSVYLGVAEQFTDIIFTSAGKRYYVGSPNDVAVIDKRLCSFKVPKIITRTPRSVNTRNMWKASEWRSWLLFYCLVCLKGILPEKYLSHLTKLVVGIEILSRSSISVSDINLAQKFLVEFYVYFQDLYGKDQMTYNVHLLLHLAKSVSNLGPLHMHDAFGFENENRLVLQLKTSPSQVSVQIAKRFLFYKSIPTFSSLFTVTSRTVEFTESFENRLKDCIHINDTILIGNGKKYAFNVEENELGFFGNCLAYKKIIHKKRRYTTECYADNLKINDSIIKTKSGKLGIITNICVINKDNNEEIIIIFKIIKLKHKRSLSPLNHIRECDIHSNTLQFCPVNTYICAMHINKRK